MRYILISLKGPTHLRFMDQTALCIIINKDNKKQLLRLKSNQIVFLYKRLLWKYVKSIQKLYASKQLSNDFILVNQEVIAWVTNS